MNTCRYSYHMAKFFTLGLAPAAILCALIVAFGKNPSIWHWACIAIWLAACLWSLVLMFINVGLFGWLRAMAFYCPDSEEVTETLNGESVEFKCLRNGVIVGYWAYGRYDPHFPFMGYDAANYQRPLPSWTDAL